MSDPIVPEGLSDRYGRAGQTRRRPRRWVYWTLLSVFVLAGIGVAIAYYRNFGTKPITAQNAGFVVINDHTVRVNFTVTRDQPNRPADCIVRALDAQGTETGRREVYVPPTSGSASMTTVLHTIRRATSGQTYGCSYQVPPYLSRSTPPSG